MNKKFLGIFAALVVLGSTGAFASAAIGLQGGYSPAGDYAGFNGALTFKLSSVPAVFAANVSMSGNELNSIALQGDWWVSNPKLAGMFHYFYGPGFAVGVYGVSSNPGLYAAFRAVGGVNLFVVKPLELYLQAAWQPGVYVGNTLSWDGLCFPIQFGFRFWF